MDEFYSAAHWAHCLLEAKTPNELLRRSVNFLRQHFAIAHTICALERLPDGTWKLVYGADIVDAEKLQRDAKRLCAELSLPGETAVDGTLLIGYIRSRRDRVACLGVRSDLPRLFAPKELEFVSIVSEVVSLAF